MNPDFNLPPGVTQADLDGHADTTEDYSEREARKADRWQDQAVDREAHERDAELFRREFGIE